MVRIRNLYSLILIFRSDDITNSSPSYIKEKFESLLGISTDTLVDGITESDKKIDEAMLTIKRRWSVDDKGILTAYKFLLYTSHKPTSPSNVKFYFNKISNITKISNIDNTKGRIHHLLIKYLDELEIETNEVFKIFNRDIIIDDILFAQ